ncbi:MAG: transposase [Candidatus Marinimicrobia bacterium]|nr:transposase [Candidatus Neomarinimicrobiota bacterium]
MGSISASAAQNIVDRISESIVPHYECFCDKAWEAKVNNIDETSLKLDGILWVMANISVVFLMVHSNSTKEAFKELVGPWMGILVSDNYGVYQKWVGGRQKCLVHLIRAAQGLAEHTKAEIARCGRWAKAKLQRLIKMANALPSKVEWQAFYTRLRHLIVIYQDRKDKAGTYVRSLSNEIESLWFYLDAHGCGADQQFCRVHDPVWCPLAQTIPRY